MPQDLAARPLSRQRLCGAKQLDEGRNFGLEVRGSARETVRKAHELRRRRAGHFRRQADAGDVLGDVGGADCRPLGIGGNLLCRGALLLDGTGDRCRCFPNLINRGCDATDRLLRWLLRFSDEGRPAQQKGP